MEKLTAEVRSQRGKGVKTLRQRGFLPAVIYGAGVSTQTISIPYRDFEKAFANTGESTILELTIDGVSHNVLIHDIARDPIRGAPIHADFYAVLMDKPIRVKVPIVFFGESSAVKNEGGILVKVLQELEIEALPAALPKEVRADISGLGVFGARLFVKGLMLPVGVKTITGLDDVIVLVEAPRTEEELTALAGAPEAAAIAEVKTEQEVKRAAKEEAAHTEAATEKAEEKEAGAER